VNISNRFPLFSAFCECVFKYLNAREREKRGRRLIDREANFVVNIHLAFRHFLSRFHPSYFSLSNPIQMHIFIQINALSTTLSMQSFAFVPYSYFFFLLFFFLDHNKDEYYFWLKYTHRHSFIYSQESIFLVSLWRHIYINLFFFLMIIIELNMMFNIWRWRKKYPEKKHVI